MSKLNTLNCDNCGAPLLNRNHCVYCKTLIDIPVERIMNPFYGLMPFYATSSCIIPYTLSTANVHPDFIRQRTLREF